MYALATKLIFPSANENLFDVFKLSVEEFSSEEEERRDSYAEKVKLFFLKDEMHDVLHYDDSASVKVVPSTRHTSYFIIPSEEWGRLICAFYDKLCGSQKSDETSTDTSDLIGLGGDSIYVL
jgi:hypothetical protein